MSRYIFFFILMSIMHSCTHKTDPANEQIRVDKSDRSLSLSNGIYYYKNEKLTGTITDKFTNGKCKAIEQINNGKQQGATETFYEDGSKESTRYYTAGEKDSVQLGWWPNTLPKYIYHFANGKYNGDFTEWYIDGNMMQQIHYQNGEELSGKGWRPNGKLYMNFVVRNGRRYGLMNANLCYEVKDGKVE